MTEEQVQKAKQYGPILWGDLHRSALRLGVIRTEDRRQEALGLLYALFRGLREHVGCNECESKLVLYLRRVPIKIGEDFFEWTVDFHNAVNVHLEPPKRVLSYTEGRSRWRV